ncbi:Protein kinase-like domain [Pseudocohnilembus persalinus]|uniref:Mitogen-activated protein kinase n=1 Tax=Pseudocohnilembus persalinus TaxID=266149 RepID=A0A0V0R4B7_PSEPJ|nr:Protein kinase-like domain [Pseudocohnilembus persalinus]|eukprot:KRX09319.1 Protein kinase-like domain [Pseudocohnilembus persalinus]
MLIGHKFLIDEKYDITKIIGHGAYGVVASGNDTKKNVKVAIKKVTNAFEDLIDAKRILREIKLLKFFDHDNIIKLHDVLQPENRTGYEDIYIVTELMETDLHRVIYSRQELTDEHVQYFLYQLLRGLKFMHSANVIHRDLKPSNLLVNKNCDLTICDLGLARGFDQEDETKTEYVVTRWYRAPEVILQASEYTKAVDIWSVGCIFAELLGRTPLFPGKDYLEQIQRTIAILGTPKQEEISYITNDGALKYIRSLPKRTKQKLTTLFPEANPVGLDLLEKMLTFNPNHRYTIEQCLQHPYFEELHNPEDEPASEQMFDFSWDDFKLTKERLQSYVYDEAQSFQAQQVLQPKNDLQQQQILKQQQQSINQPQITD